MTCVRLIASIGQFIVLYFLCLFAQAQSTNAPFSTDYYHLLDRLEISQQIAIPGFQSTFKPYSRTTINALLDSGITSTSQLSSTDHLNIAYLRADSREGDTSVTNSLIPTDYQTQSKSPRPFYRQPVDLFAKRWSGFDWHINPVIGLGVGQQADTTHTLKNYTFGLETRGSFNGWVGFYGFFTINQAIYPRHVQAYRQRYELVGRGLAPGEGVARMKTDDQALFYGWRGYLTTRLLKITDVQLGRDRLFIGSGYRSLVLSDTSDPYWFLKLTTHIGRFDYVNLYTVLRNTESPSEGSTTNPPKYMFMHHLGLNIGQHINVGVFEAVVFSRPHIDFTYINPVILYRYVESSLGSSDNAFIGVDFKGKWGGQWLVYSQVMLDEFVLKDLRAMNGSWANKFALQLGAKYINALGIANFDLQGEMNLARPFMYTHQSSQTNYVHDNQPLAHPLGSNFIEGIGIARYQHKRFQGVGTLGLMMFGTDPPGLNLGGNLLTDYLTRLRFYDNYIGQGRKTFVTYVNLRLSYQVWHNGFVDLQYLYRLQSSEYKPDSYEYQLASLSLRLNLPYRNMTF
ncbi:hypothetical protein IC229_32160 [Spirosoma sp. BT702]|uniref:Capsule assembly Wzi family protein n=1 Tax=Spirosoma profusum TaxID=2771354 RepID=A0A927AVS4_9BACT|nr:hypothetical protein [Spirosoma profusum]MBD2705317.1 hypothetical protein [Spirosoma profusum]